MDSYRDISEFYDCEHDDFADDIEFYRNVIQAGPVLEIGTGTGRIARALAEAGLELWGIDPSESMLRRARERTAHLPTVHLICGTATTAELAERFDAAILPLNTLWHADTMQEQLEMLTAARQRLAAGGLLVVDLANPLTMAERGARGEVRQVFRGPCGDGTLTRLSAAWDDEGEQLLDVYLTYHITRTGASPSAVVADFSFRYVYRAEAELLATLAGFEVKHVYGSYDLEPYSAESPRILLLAVAP